MEFDDNEINLNMVKDVLTSDKIKLWLPPYHGVEINGSQNVKDLANKLSGRLNLPTDDILNCLVILQQKAIDNLQEKEAYQSSGLATLKIRPPHSGGKHISLKIRLESDGKVLKNIVSQQLLASPDKLKMICKGKVIQDNGSLHSQGVKHGVQIMTLLLTSGPDEMAAFESNNALLDSTKRDINLLAGKRNEEGESYLQITDQSGKTLSLPKNEQKALVLAMTLHEKGRAALKTGSFDLALILLLEAEKEFSQCNSQLLEQVDNYGLLSLDMAWCYLNLQSLSQLPDAQLRLQKCEQVFHKSYGPNLERLVALKGSSGNEGALFLRLHLLQAIVLYHQGKIDETKVLLEQVERDLSGLIVDDVKLSNLTELGYSLRESRLALRESKGDLDLAATIIENKKAEKKKNYELEKKERVLMKEKEKLGKCVDGSWVEPAFHKALLSMGYTSNAARWALAQTGNRISDAVALIQNHPEQLPLTPVSDADVAQVVGLGYDPQMATAALMKNFGDISRAVEELVKNDGLIEGAEDLLTNECISSPSTSKDENFKKSSSYLEKKEQEKDAYSRVSEGITDTDDDYLDSTLTAEQAFLNQYKELISKR